MDILIIPGDGIGPEIAAATTEVLRVLDVRFGLGLRLREAEAGLASFERHGTTLRDEVMEAALAAEGVVLGPMSTNDYPSPERGGVPVPATFRRRLDLYANIRPSYVRPGVPAPATAMDLVFVRENLEEFYADRNMALGSGEIMPTEDVALAIGKITAQASRRIARVACEVARRRQRRVTIVHKANALRIFQGLFLREARRAAADYPDVEVDEVIVDAMAALLIRTPERFDVVVTTNMFGDILTDEAAELSGGLGLGGSLNHGDRHAVAQAAHGSAPDIAGQDRANPTALIQSAAMLLDRLGVRQGRDDLIEAARCLKEGVDALLAGPATRTPDLGGRLGTKAFGRAVAERIARA